MFNLARDMPTEYIELCDVVAVHAPCTAAWFGGFLFVARASLLVVGLRWFHYVSMTTQLLKRDLRQGDRAGNIEHYQNNQAL